MLIECKIILHKLLGLVWEKIEIGLHFFPASNNLGDKHPLNHFNNNMYMMFKESKDMSRGSTFK